MTRDDNFNSVDRTFEKTLEILNGLDFERLNDSYFRRRESFMTSVNDDTHKEIKVRLLYSVVLVDVCMKIYREFLEAISKRSEDIKNKAEQDLLEHNETSTEAFEQLSGLLQEIQTKNITDIDEEYRQFVEGRQVIYQEILEARQNLAVFRLSKHTLSIYFIALGSWSTYHSLARLFEITDMVLIGDVLKLVLQTLFGLLPFVGTPGSALWGLYDIFDKKVKKYKEAGDLLTQLDNFADVAFNWCVITQLLIELNEGKSSLQINVENGMENLVGDQEIERLSRVIQSKIEAHVNMLSDQSG